MGMTLTLPTVPMARTVGPHEKTMFPGWSDGHLRGVDAQDPKVLWNEQAQAEPVSAVAYSEKHRMVFTGGLDGRLRVWKVEGDRLIANASIIIPGDGINDVALGRDDDTLVLSSSDGSISICNSKTGGELKQIELPLPYM